ncbi:MAG TPA: PEP/pyruvate-binding domain-containing protein [Candidatus Obscuribacterales bacterium]
MSGDKDSPSRDDKAPLVYHFPGPVEAPIAEVGGKAFGLMELCRARLPVPSGFVLTVRFFQPWIDAIKSTSAWDGFLRSSEWEHATACQALKAAAEDLTLDTEQAEALVHALKALAPGTLFAVRSSSPEEDIEGTSFAGGYETVLGVTREHMADSIKRAFASCLDHRIVVYKAQHGFDIYDPRIAVIVQAQVDSDVAGVGFSLNPVTNDFDETVLSASWGLGESVVAGQVTPDTYIVDKHTLEIKERRIGNKATAIRLLSSGGTEERREDRTDIPALSDEDAVQLTRLTTAVEKHFGKPMDIEWAIAGGAVYLLQARPITAYVPVAPELLTAPGQPRRLYLDATISAQALYKPLSPMGTSVLQTFVKYMATRLTGRDYSANIDTTLAYVRYGRIYLNVSNALSMLKKDKLARALTHIDPVAAAALDQVPEGMYRARSQVSGGFKLSMLAMYLRRLPFIVEVALFPGNAHQQIGQAREEHLKELRRLAELDMSVSELAREIFDRTANLAVPYFAPIIMLSKVIAPLRLRHIFPESAHELVASLDRSLPNNVTVQMGLELNRLAKRLPGPLSVTELEQGIESRTLPGDFLEGWSHFLDTYGHRGPGELDIASPRYRDNPGMLLQQIAQVLDSSGVTDDAEARFQRSQAARRQAYLTLRGIARHKGWLVRKELDILYRIIENFAGYRETPKYHVVFALDVLRRRLLKEALALVKAGRLEAPEQVFDLTLDNLEDALADATLDLSSLAKANRAFSDRLAQVPELPRLFDSRGRILRPRPRPAGKGEAAGTAVSPGVATGPAKTLHSCDEKPLLKGEVLIARATDPGWTPLFVNAAAVVLEVGGMLQHGALVAREYGIPCVTGVTNATSRWDDGTVLEVDGTAGIVRIASAARPDAG